MLLPHLASDIGTKARVQAASISRCKGVWLQPVGRIIIIHNPHRPAQQSIRDWHQTVREVRIVRVFVLAEILPDQGYVNWCLWDLDAFGAEALAEQDSHLSRVGYHLLTAHGSCAAWLVFIPCRSLTVLTAVPCRATASACEDLRLLLLTPLADGHSAGTLALPESAWAQEPLMYHTKCDARAPARVTTPVAQVVRVLYTTQNYLSCRICRTHFSNG